MSRSTHKLHFDALSPQDFERLCFWLVRREGYERVEYLGEAGNDRGRDVTAWKEDRLWVFQCKRVQKFGLATAKAEIQKLRNLPAIDQLRPLPFIEQPDELVFVVSRKVGVDLREKIREAWGDASTCHFWSSAELDERVKRHPEIIEEFFGRPSPPDRLWTAPRRNPHYTGREIVLKEIYKRLQEGGSAALSQAITGLGGIGKTQTSIEYCHRHADDYRFVLWANAASSADLATDYLKFAKKLELVSRQEGDVEKAREAICGWLSLEKRWLLVLDNADDPKILEPYLPGRSNGHILVTSRASTVPGFASPLALEVMLPDEAVKFLRGRRRPAPSEEHLVAALANELGYLPLALEQAAAYLVETPVSYEEYLEAWRQRQLEHLEKMPSEDKYRRTVATTWLLNFKQVAEVTETAADVLWLSACLAPDDVPFELLAEGAPHLGPRLASEAADLKEPVGVPELLTHLVRYSLIEVDPERKIYRIHRLVQASIRSQMAPATQRKWLERVIRALDSLLPYPNVENWHRANRLLPQVLELVEPIADLKLKEAGPLMLRAGSLARVQGRHAVARRLEEECLAFYRRLLGEEHPKTLTAMNNLAGTLYSLGDLRGARKLNEQVLEAQFRVLGENHPDTLNSMNNLGGTLRAQGLLRKARDLYEKTLDAQRQELGQEDPDTLASMNNLALTLGDLGHYQAARELHEQELEISLRVMGKEHPSTLNSMNNLAGALRDQGRLQHARRLNDRALKAYRRVLGERHPDTLNSMNNLALTLRVQGDVDGAMELQEQVVESCRQVLGREHPDTLIAMNNLALTLRVQSDLGGARALHEKALEISRRVLGEEHLHTLTSLSNLALVLRSQGELQDAMQVNHKVLEIRRQLLGPDHPDTLTSMNNLALTIYAQGESLDAQLLQEQALVASSRVLGERHPTTLTARENLARILKHQGGRDAGASEAEEESDSSSFTEDIDKLIEDVERAAEAALGNNDANRKLQTLGFHKPLRRTPEETLRYSGKETHGFARPFGDLDGPAMGDLRF